MSLWRQPPGCSPCETIWSRDLSTYTALWERCLLTMSYNIIQNIYHVLPSHLTSDTKQRLWASGRWHTAIIPAPVGWAGGLSLSPAGRKWRLWEVKVLIQYLRSICDMLSSVEDTGDTAVSIHILGAKSQRVDRGSQFRTGNHPQPYWYPAVFPCVITHMSPSSHTKGRTSVNTRQLYPVCCTCAKVNTYKGTNKGTQVWASISKLWV